VIVDSHGNLVVADAWNYRVRQAAVQSGSVARPSVSASANVQNSATYLPPGAPGMLATIWGEKFASGEFHAPLVPLPTSLLATSVQVDGSPIPMLHITPIQINVQLPVSLASGTHTLRVVTVGVESDPISFQAQASAPGIFVWDGTRGVVFNVENGALNSPANAATRDQWVTIYANGQGLVNPAVETGAAAGLSPLSRTPEDPVVFIGGKQAELNFSGLVPGLVGLWQVNAKVPADAPTGAAVSLFLTMNGVASNQVTMSVK
jgi:minor extracellular serine protease Vpr